MEVDIEFFDAKEGDFHGIKTLLQDLLGGTEFNTSELADAIIAQVHRSWGFMEHRQRSS